MEDTVYLDTMYLKFTQEPDVNQNDDNDQVIEFHSENNGVGNYFWIKTKRWAFSSADDLSRLAQRVRDMEEINNKYENNGKVDINKR